MPLKMATETQKTVTNASTVFIGQNPRRTALIVSVPSGIQVTISQLNPAILGTGVSIVNANQPIAMCSCDYGDWMKRQLFAIASAASVLVGIIEVEESEEWPGVNPNR